MIVKNEMKVLQRCFDSVYPYIDHWVICDTGSTDGTPEFITSYFQDKKIPGKLHHHEWKNFGHNRTLAVKAAKKTADYLLLMDADFIFCIKDPNFKKKPLDKTSYLIKYEGALDYRQTLFVSGKKSWKYVGVTHEYIMCEGPNITSGPLDSFTFDHLADGGNRSDKFERDIFLLTEGLKREPKNIRYMFYLARSHKDLGHWTEAIKYYEMRAKAGGWAEETYISLLDMGICMMKRGDSYDEFKGVLLKAYQTRPTRLEALHTLISYCRLNELYEDGFNYGIKAFDNKYPSGDNLFINKEVHEFGFFNELALCAYYTDNPLVALKIYKKLQDNNSPHIKTKIFEDNYRWFKQAYEKKIRTSTSEQKHEKKHKEKTHKEKTKQTETKKRVTISLTTIPSRLKYLKNCLESLKAQTYSNIQINVCVPKRCKKENCEYILSSELLDSKINFIGTSEDYGPITKLFGSLDRLDEDDLLIICDDDIIYDKQIVERLVEASEKYPDAAIGFCGWNAQGLIENGYYDLLYNEEKELETYTPANILEGYRGVLVKPRFFNSKIYNYGGYPESMFYVDDVWINGHLALNGIPKIIIKYSNERQVTKDETWFKLWVANHFGHKSENNSLSMMPEFSTFNLNGVKAFANQHANLWSEDLQRSREYIESSDSSSEESNSSSEDNDDFSEDDDSDDFQSLMVTNDLFSKTETKYAIIITTYERPEYLELFIQSILNSDLNDVTIIVVDDHSQNPLVKIYLETFINKLNDKGIGAAIIYKAENKNMFDSIDIGWSTAYDMNVEYIINLDSDTLVRPDWLGKLQTLYNDMLVENFTKNNLIVSGFNNHRKHHKVVQEFDNYLLKESIGGINMFFHRTLFEELQPLLTNVRWDYNICNYIRSLGAYLVCSKPSVIQHIGFNGHNSTAQNKNYDIALDFYISKGDYVFIPCLDSSGNDKENGGWDIDKILSDFQNDPTVVCINSNGWLKTDIKLNLEEWDVYDITKFTGSYIKKEHMKHIKQLQPYTNEININNLV